MIEKMLYRLDKRVNDKTKQTIITSNLSLDEIKGREERMFSRLCDNAKILVIQ
jgi:DNA replication protein DnaC